MNLNSDQSESVLLPQSPSDLPQSNQVDKERAKHNFDVLVGIRAGWPSHPYVNSDLSESALLWAIGGNNAKRARQNSFYCLLRAESDPIVIPYVNSDGSELAVWRVGQPTLMSTEMSFLCLAFLLV